MTARAPCRGRLAGRALLAAGAATLLAGCGANFGFPDPVTEQGERTLELWRVFFPIAAVVVAMIWGLVLWSVIRYRRRSDAVPPQRQTMLKLELFYTAVPLAMVAILFALTIQANDELNALERDPGLRVRVTGFQWQWQFDYVDDGVSTSGTPAEPAELVLPVGRTVEFDLVAADVIHSFWVPEFLSKRDVIPEVDNKIQFFVKEPGTWVGRCAEYCGLSHWQMSFTLRALPADEFEAWLDAARGREQPVIGSVDDGAPDQPATTETTGP
jgi:cytochrome c oxidase subunit 2